MLSVNSPNCLQDPVFSDFFKNLCEKNDIVEFYLTENSGSFLLLDKYANIYCLIVKNEHDLKLHYDLALDNKAPQELLQQLQNGEKIPYFWQANDFQSEWTDWSTCLLSAQKVQGLHTYYYAIAKGPLSFDIQKDKILSYHNYLEKIDNTNAFSVTAKQKTPAKEAV